MVDVNEIFLNLGAPKIDVIIDDSLKHGVQVDSGSSVNLMNVNTLEKLGLIPKGPKKPKWLFAILSRLLLI